MRLLLIPVALGVFTCPAESETTWKFTHEASSLPFGGPSYVQAEGMPPDYYLPDNRAVIATVTCLVMDKRFSLSLRWISPELPPKIQYLETALKEQQKRNGYIKIPSSSLVNALEITEIDVRRDQLQSAPFYRFSATLHGSAALAFINADKPLERRVSIYHGKRTYSTTVNFGSVSV